MSRYLLLDGTDGGATTPDSAAVSVTDDLDLRVKVSFDDIDATVAELLTKYTTSGNQRAYRFIKNTNSSVGLTLSTNGSSFTTANSTSSLTGAGFGNGDVFWIRVTFEASVEVIFYTSSDGVTWTQFGDAVASALAGIDDSTAIVTVGDRVGSTDEIIGRLYQGQIYNGIAGTLVGHFNANDFSVGDANTATAVASTGETWTIYGSAAIIAADNLVGLGHATGGEEGDALRTALKAAGTAYQGTIKMLRDYLGDTTVGYASGRKQALGKN